MPCILLDNASGEVVFRYRLDPGQSRCARHPYAETCLYQSGSTVKNLGSISVVVLIAAVALPSFGQQNNAPGPAPSRAASAAAMDCGPGMKPHDHAAEKGMGASTMKDMPCAPHGSASAAKSKSKKALHDHGKENKQH